MVMMKKQTLRKKKMGRPPLYPGEETCRVTLSVDNGTHAMWKRVAKERGVSMAQVMRDAMDEVEKH